MSMVSVTLSLGSNLGDRAANITQAIKRISEAFSVRDMEKTEVLETEAFGFEGPSFLNCAVRFTTDRSPLEVLSSCKEIERAMGRKTAPAEFRPDGSRIYHDRIIDIDILFYGDLEMKTGNLTIPHPQVYERPFIKELLLLLQSGRDAAGARASDNPGKGKVID